MPGYPHEWMDTALFTIPSFPTHAAALLTDEYSDDAEYAFIRLVVGGRFTTRDGLRLADFTPPPAADEAQGVRRLEDIMGISSKFPTHQNLNIWRCPPVTSDMSNVLRLEKDIHSAVSVLIQ